MLCLYTVHNGILITLIVFFFFMQQKKYASASVSFKIYLGVQCLYQTSDTSTVSSITTAHTSVTGLKMSKDRMGCSFKGTLTLLCENWQLFILVGLLTCQENDFQSYRSKQKKKLKFVVVFKLKQKQIYCHCRNRQQNSS